MGIHIQNYPTAGYIRIEGINYSYDFFRQFAREHPLNVPFVITRRDNDLVRVERVPAPMPAPMPAPAPAPVPEQAKSLEIEVKMETEEVPRPQVYKRNVGRPKRHKMIEEAPEAKD